MKKLVRDKYKDIFDKEWNPDQYEICNPEDKIGRLLKKLDEEVLEFKTDKTSEELADILDVIDEIVNELWIDKQKFEVLRKMKNKEKWWFKLGVIWEKHENRSK